LQKNNRNKSRKTTTTLPYKHSNLLKTHTHIQNQKGEKNNKECAHVQKVNKVKKQQLTTTSTKKSKTN